MPSHYGMTRTKHRHGRGLQDKVAPSPTKHWHEDRDWEEGSESSDFEEDSGESGSDWEPIPVPVKRNTHPPANRCTKQFVYHTRSGSKSTPFSMLFSMPMDILFEVFARLRPEDLVALTRTNKALRQTLFLRNSTPIWKAARESIGAPEPFPDLSEQLWAWLLFGGPFFRCHCCGTHGTEEIDFRLRRRVCKPCKKANFVLESEVPSQFPDYEPGILDLIPHTQWCNYYDHTRVSRRRRRRRRNRKGRLYWVSDIVDIAHRWGELQKAVRRRIPGAKQRMDDLCSEQTELVTKVLEEADRCNDWFNRYIKSRRADRYQAIVARFVMLGYDKEDVEPIETTMEYGWQDLTDHVWNDIHPALEPIVQQTRTSRLLPYACPTSKS